MTAETTDVEKPWVLIVDDDQDNRELLAEFLEVGDYAAVSCGAASEAERILDSRPPPCLVISDMRMPDMDGRTFVARLRARAGFAEMPVVFVTGASAGSLGTVDEPVLTKPVDLDALMTVVDRHCGPGSTAAACSSGA